MNTIKLYWQDSYMDECSATITNINNDEIVMDKTIIFSFSGGQESDLGWINEYEVLNSRLEDKTIVYTISEHHNLKIGDIVTLKIDWNKRYSIMKNHLAIELIHLLLIQKYPDIQKIGANVAQNKGRLDYIWQGNIASEFEYLQDKLNDIIDKDIIVEKGYDDVINEIRYWKLDGFDKVLCCGTHIKSTKELIKINIKRKSGGSNKERVEAWCD